MKFSLNGWAATCYATVAWLLLTLSPMHAALISPDFQIGPNVSVDSLTTASSGTNYLVVWRDLSGGPNAAVISAALVGPTGVVSGSFSISNALAMPQAGPVQRIRAAFDSVNYLVVWHDLRADGAGVRGALVSPQGTVVGGSDFLIASTVNTQNINPQVTFSGGSFFVAWQDSSSSDTGNQIFYTSVSPAGSPSSIQSVPLLGTGPATQQFEFLIPGQDGEKVLVYQDIGSTPNATYAVRIESDNSISGPSAGTKMFTNDFSPGGAGAPIGGGYLADTQEYLLLASLGTNLTCSVSRAWLKPDGEIALSTAPLAFVGEGATPLDENNYPLTVFNGSDEFLFLRNSEVTDVTYHIFMKRVNVDGTDNDPNMAVVDEASSGILNGATAAAIGSQYLVVWMDGRRRVADPPLQTNVYAALIDGTQLGSTLRPYIRPGAGIAPQVGIAPLTVATGSGTSTGIIDSGIWDFGDGSATTDLIATTHKYVNAGSYIAKFSLLKSGLVFNQFFHIDVEGNDIGGAGGPPQAIGGIINPSSTGINTDVVIGSFTAALNFVKTNADSFHITGRFDASRIPVYLTGQTCTFTIGTNSYSFNLLADGSFVSASGTTPVLTFQINPFNGVFQLNGSSDNLLAALTGSGVDNATASKLPVSIPISATFSGLHIDEFVSAQYTATVGASGKINYSLGTIGTPGSGYFNASAGYANERTIGKTGPTVHDFGVAGNLTLPNATTLVKATTGVWRVTFGNYSQDIPVGSITLSGSTYSFTPKRVTSGITQFAYNQISGGYVLVLKGIPAQGEDPSGMPLSTSQVTRADMAVSVNLALDAGAQVQSSTFLRLVRKDATKKKWTFR